MSNTPKYQKKLGSTHPGMIIILIDQSGSMGFKYGATTKSEFTATAVNKTIQEIIAASTSGDIVSPRVHLCVIGYGDTVSPLVMATIDNVKKMETIMKDKQVDDGAGGIVTRQIPFDIYVEAKASGSTPMAEAFALAKQYAKAFCENPIYKEVSYPPIVINITDGEPDNFQTASAEAKEMMKNATDDGDLIFINAHLGNDHTKVVTLPNSNKEFSGDKLAEFLFDISSVLPEGLAASAKEQEFNVEPGARGFMFNADTVKLIKLLRFGTEVAKKR